MKMLFAGAAGWIAFSIADQILYGGRTVQVLPKFAREIAAGFGIQF